MLTQDFHFLPKSWQPAEALQLHNESSSNFKIDQAAQI
jgi:hypothetical protein